MGSELGVGRRNSSRGVSGARGRGQEAHLGDTSLLLGFLTTCHFALQPTLVTTPLRERLGDGPPVFTLGDERKTRALGEVMGREGKGISCVLDACFVLGGLHASLLVSIEVLCQRSIRPSV